MTEKQYYGNGKGSRRRGDAKARKLYEEAFDAIFGKRDRTKRAAKRGK